MKQEHYILFRFMSYDEAIKLLKGESLHNETDFKLNGAHTQSKGFCFMDGDKSDAEYAYDYLSGVVSEDVCLIVRYNHNSLLTESHGRYADPYGSFFDTITEDEVCIMDYDINVMTPIRYGFINGHDDFTWYDMLGEREDIIKLFEQRKAEKDDEERKKHEKEQQAKLDAEKAARIEQQKFMGFYYELGNDPHFTDVTYKIESDYGIVRHKFSFETDILAGFNVSFESFTYDTLLRHAEMYLMRSMIPKEFKNQIFEMIRQAYNKQFEPV